MAVISMRVCVCLCLLARLCETVCGCVYCTCMHAFGGSVDWLIICLAGERQKERTEEGRIWGVNTLCETVTCMHASVSAPAQYIINKEIFLMY